LVTPLGAADAAILVNPDDLTAHAVGDLAQLPLLIGCRLSEGGDSKIDNRSAHGSALTNRHSQSAPGCMNNQLLRHTGFAGPCIEFMTLSKRLFSRFFAYTSCVEAAKIRHTRALS